MTARWTWEDGQPGSGRWKEYDAKTSRQLEQAFRKHTGEVVLNKGWFASHAGKYHVVFAASSQINQHTGFIRAVQRNGEPTCDAADRGTEDAGAATATPQETPLELELKEVFLSTGTTDSVAVDFSKLKHKSEKQVKALILESVPEAARMMDRLGQVPVLTYIYSTYTSGLPSLQGNRSTLEHSMNALKFVLDQVEFVSPKTRRAHLKLLCESYQSCQAEQARVIDYLFGILSGRDKGLREQILSVVDTHKQATLDMVIGIQNPALAGATDGSPAAQLAHLQSRYLMDIGKQLSLRGQQAASLDRCAPPQLSSKMRSDAIALFREHFSVREVCKAFITDVNHQDPDAERIIYRDTLGRWAGEAAQQGFNSHSIYYDEDKAQEYDGKPTEEYQPFLRPEVAMQILEHVFLGGKK